MDRRVLPAALVVVVALADLAGAHWLAFLVLIVAVPATAAAALAALGDWVDPRRPVAGARLQAAVGGLATLLLLAAAASRAPLEQQGVVPPLATAAVVACLAVLIVEAAAAAVAEVRLQRQRLRRVPGQLDERLRDEERDDREGAAQDDARLKQPLRRRRAA
jgi:hypothetical protein